MKNSERIVDRLKDVLSNLSVLEDNVRGLICYINRLDVNESRSKGKPVVDVKKIEFLIRSWVKNLESEHPFFLVEKEEVDLLVNVVSEELNNSQSNS